MKGSPNKNKPKKVVVEAPAELIETPEPVPFFEDLEDVQVVAPEQTHSLTRAIAWALVWVGVIVLFFV